MSTATTMLAMGVVLAFAALPFMLGAARTRDHHRFIRWYLVGTFGVVLIMVYVVVTARDALPAPIGPL